MLTNALSVFIGVVAAGLLWVFYRRFEEGWPVEYESISSRFDLFARGVPVWHLTTRAIVVFLTAILTGHVATVGGCSPSIAVLSLAGLHVATTSGRALWDAQFRSHRRGIVAIYDALTTVVILGSAWAGLLAAPHLTWLLPSGGALVDAIWTALVLALMLTSIERLSSLRETTDVDALGRARKDLGKEIIDDSDVLANEFQVDTRLMESVILTEALQRPRWLRQTEYQLGRFRSGGTYGVAQMHSEHRISDHDSLVLLAQSLAGSATRLRQLDEDQRRAVIEAYFEKHNPSGEFIAHALSMYEVLEPPGAIAQSDECDTEGSPMIRVDRVQRKGFTWTLEGSALQRDGESLSIADVRSGQVFVPTRLERDAERQRWQCTVPIDVREVTISVGAAEVNIDLVYAVEFN
jgi:hypothetical protein